MRAQQRSWTPAIGCLAICGFGMLVLASIKPIRAQDKPAHTRLGGAFGVVREIIKPRLEGAADVEMLLEGIGVQLISRETAIRTTVYTNEDGRYEFPVLESGLYTLRIARPREYRPYVKESVRIEGATQLPAIVLERVSQTEFLPPTPEILGQLTGAEWMLNLPGTGEEKRVFTLTCGGICHSYQQVFRNRYDEAGWRLIVQRMIRGAQSPIINMGPNITSTRMMQEPGGPFRAETVTKWLARVRGPESIDPPLHYLPRARGPATRVIVTEYELPRLLISGHDVGGDSKGNIWYTAHRSAYAGVLDPRTGRVTEHRIPGKEQDTPDVLPGTHAVWVDKNDIVWFSEQWDHYLTGLDSRTGRIIARNRVTPKATFNQGGFGNFMMDDDGYAYRLYERAVTKIDSKTGKTVQTFPLTGEVGSAYDNIVTPDGRYWSGAPMGGRAVGLVDMKTGEDWTVYTPTPVSSGSRGGFDRQANAWFGGRGGALIRLSATTRRLTEYYPPIPYIAFYEAMPDKNGEVWAGPMHAGAYLRFDPRSERWTVYQLPEPFSHNRRAWIDNSRDPVTVWYVDNNGYLVRIQPLE